MDIVRWIWNIDMLLCLRIKVDTSFYRMLEAWALEQYLLSSVAWLYLNRQTLFWRVRRRHWNNVSRLIRYLLTRVKSMRILVLILVRTYASCLAPSSDRSPCDWDALTRWLDLINLIKLTYSGMLVYLRLWFEIGNHLVVILLISFFERFLPIIFSRIYLSLILDCATLILVQRSKWMSSYPTSWVTLSNWLSNIFISLLLNIRICLTVVGFLLNHAL